MTVTLTALENFETPDNSDEMALLTDGMTYIEFHLETGSGTVNAYDYTLKTDPEVDKTFSAFNSSTNDKLPAEIPRLRMPTPIIIRVGVIFRLSDEEVLSDRPITFSLEDETGTIVATETVRFTEVVTD